MIEIPDDIKATFAGQRVFVTGASGFIGWHVATKLTEAGAQVRALVRSATKRSAESFEWHEGDLLRRDSLDTAMKDCRYVFHVAGEYRFWARDPREIYANNVQGTINVLEAARAANVEKIVATSTVGLLQHGSVERPTDESRLGTEAQFKGPYKRSKFAAYLEAKNRANAGWPIVSALPTAPIGPHDVKPTPTGMIVVQFLNRRIPMLARAGLNFVDVRQCAFGHLLCLVRGRPGERYLLGGTNLLLSEFLQRLERYAQHRAPRMYAPHWLSVAGAYASEMFARLSSNDAPPFVTRESVSMSRVQHFTSNAKAQAELGYEITPIDDAIRDAVADFAARGLVPKAAGELAA
jgi:dihydroflavonol-4-reductase